MIIVGCQSHVSCIIIAYSLSELPDCQVPLAMKPLVIDRILEMSMHPSCNCEEAQEQMAILVYLTQSPKAHRFIVRRDVVKNMLEVCELKQKMVCSELQSSQPQQAKEDPMEINALKYVIVAISLVSTVTIIIYPPSSTIFCKL